MGELPDCCIEPLGAVCELLALPVMNPLQALLTLSLSKRPLMNCLLQTLPMHLIVNCLLV